MYMHCLEMYNNMFFLHNVYAVYRYSFVAGDAFVRLTTCIRDVELFLPHDAYMHGGVYAMACCLSVARWHCIEADRQIELVFGTDASLGLSCIVF